MPDPITIAALAGISGFALYALGLKTQGPTPTPGGGGGGGTPPLTIVLATQGPGRLCEVGSGVCAPGQVAVPVGASITLQATPEQGATFVGWQTAGGLEPATANPLTEAVYSSGSITAVFAGGGGGGGPAPVTVTLQVSPSPAAGGLSLNGPQESGAVFVNTPSPITLQAVAGDSVVLQAIPSSGWQFDHFDLGGTYSNQTDGQGNGFTSLAISASITITAYFTPLASSSTLFLSASGPGQMCDLSGNCARSGSTQYPVTPPLTVTLIASPDPGPLGGLINYLVQQVTINGQTFSNPGQIPGGHFGANGLDWVFPVTITADTQVAVTFG